LNRGALRAKDRHTEKSDAWFATPNLTFLSGSMHNVIPTPANAKESSRSVNTIIITTENSMRFDVQKNESNVGELLPTQGESDFSGLANQNIALQSASNGGSTLPLGSPHAPAPVAEQPACNAAAPGSFPLWGQLPSGLRERAQWCVAREDKIPLIAATGLHRASVTDPSKWRSFDDACRVAAEHGLRIGYVFIGG
jgi:hypothetical protein